MVRVALLKRFAYIEAIEVVGFRGRESRVIYIKLYINNIVRILPKLSYLDLGP